MNITIVGTGQIGASLGLALAPYRKQIVRVGLDKLLPVSGKARGMGAIDRVAVNLSSAVRKAQIVILALPVNALPETFQAIADSLLPDALVIETATAKVQALEWAESFLAPSQPYAGVLPVLPAAADASGSRPRADLFTGGLWLTAETRRLSDSVWRQIQALAALTGAQAQKMSSETIDRLAILYDTLPRLLSAALLNATVDVPGWFDARKLAGQPYAALTGGLARPDDDQILLDMLAAHADLAVQDVDVVLDTLRALREMLVSSDGAAVDVWLRAARDVRQQALKAGDVPVMPPQKALDILLG